MTEMRGTKTSFARMFQPGETGADTIKRVEIPLIQRDYAQGRDERGVNSIRADFLGVLIEALVGDETVDLDFVYGEIGDGTLRPLDGQQRLTTLFLIHWYIAARTDRLHEAAAVLRFEYATRASAELFCRELVKPEHSPGDDFSTPKTWITDQAWYLHAWRHDPTIQSMLNMLDAVHERIIAENIDLDSAWERLMDESAPAVSFYLLPIDDMPSGEELYIKMNSRGKPLTDFENFKARLEKLFHETLPKDDFDAIIHKLDGVWSDVLWSFHGGDHLIDDEFLRYLEFIIEISEWRDNVVPEGTLLERAERAFDVGNPNAASHIAFLTHAFDTWVGVDDVRAAFEEHFVDLARSSTASQTGRVPLDTTNLNLFEGCLELYGKRTGNRRLFSLAETLMLFAVLIHRQYATEEIAARLRILRNLVDGADDEVRLERMGDLIPSVEQLIRDGDLATTRGFNPDRVQDELDKIALIETHPELEHSVHSLEDHPLLRGRIFAFDLDPESLQRHATVFPDVVAPQHWPILTGALLAKGDYGYPRTAGRAVQLGTGDPKQSARWRGVFSNRGRGRNQALRAALASLLDDVAADGGGSVGHSLQRVTDEFVEQARSTRRFTWRAYLATYPEMREGETGVYYGEYLQETGQWRHSMCMLRTPDLSGSGRYRDPYLWAMYRVSGLASGIETLWFSGYEFQPRWLVLSASGAGIRIVPDGFELAPPADAALSRRFRDICAQHGATSDTHLPVAQVDLDGELVDTEDRVAMGAALLTALVAAGL